MRHRKLVPDQAEAREPATPRPLRIAGAFGFSEASLPWGKAIRAAVTSGIAFLLGVFSGHIALGDMAYLGGFVSLFVFGQPYRQRAVMLAVVGLGLAASLALGLLAAPYWGLEALVLGVVATAATWLTGAWRIPAPGAFQFVLVACIAAAIPPQPAAISTDILFALIGSLIAWLIAMAGWLFHPHRPEDAMVAAAYRAVARYAACLGTKTADHARHTAALALEKTRATVLEVADPEDASVRRIRLLGRKAEDLFRSLVAWESDGRATPLARSWVRAIESVGSRLVHGGESPEVPPALPGRAGRRLHQELTRAGRLLTEHLPLSPIRRGERPLLPTPVDRLRQAFSSESLVRPAALRMGTAVIAGTVVSRLLGNPHPYWVPLTIAAVLQGPTLPITGRLAARRTIQRALGTLAGLAVVAAFLWVNPGVAAGILLVMAFQACMILFVARNYGFSVVFVTGLALMALHLVSHFGVLAIVRARLIETLVGSALGLLAAILLWSRGAGHQLKDEVAAVLTSLAELLRVPAGGRPTTTAVREERQAISRSLLHLSEVCDSALNEAPEPRVAVQLWPTVTAVQRMGYRILSLSGSALARMPAHRVARAAAVLDRYARAVEQGTPAPTDPLPALPGYATFGRDGAALAEALAGVSRDS
jgi:uncharacterized membrane protein YccC